LGKRWLRLCAMVSVLLPNPASRNAPTEA
jgi:hypothetical protein